MKPTDDPTVAVSVEENQATVPVLDEAEAPPRRRGIDWGPFGRKPIMLLAGVGLVDAIDRGILAGVLVSVQEDLGFSDFQLGLLDTAYVFAGLLVALPAGYLADRHRRTRIISLVLASWAAISAATAAARNFGQFFTARAALGLGETIDDPASQSLICDYYPADIRSRVFSYHRVTPTLGRALGIALGGAVGAMLGWRWAFLLVGIPGSLLAFGVWRLREPRRGAADQLARSDATKEPAPHELTEHTDHDPHDTDDSQDRRSLRSVVSDWGRAFRIPSLRALVIGTAIASGALTGIAFWAAAYHQRHSGMTEAQAGTLTGALILLGAISGTLTGGRLGDRFRERAPGAPLVFAGASTILGAILIFVSVQDGLPIWTVRVPLQIVAVASLVAALPTTNAMLGEVTPAAIRGTAFSMLRMASTVIGAFSPPLLGWIALRREFVTVDGEVVGHLGFGFSVFLPLLLLGALVLFSGAPKIDTDRKRAARLGGAPLEHP